MHLIKSLRIDFHKPLLPTGNDIMISILKNTQPVICIFCFIIFMHTGCSGDKKEGKKKVLAIINGYELTVGEYEAKLAQELDYTHEYKTTPEARKEFLETLIQKETLIQEAARLGLAKRQDFIQAIEKYWEATLIKTLMEEKIKEIARTTMVMDDEIKSYYTRMKSEDETLPPLEQIEPDIAGQLKEEKQTQALNEWINEVKNRAKVDINK